MNYTLEQLIAGREKIVAHGMEITNAYNEEIHEVRRKLAVIDQNIWRMKKEAKLHTADSITEEYIALRDERTAVKKDYTATDNKLVEEMEKRESWLMEAADSIGAQSIKSNFGTAFIQTKSRYNCSDWHEYYTYIKEHDRFDLLEKRPAQGPLSKFIEEGESLPPGISTYSERTITVRRS